MQNWILNSFCQKTFFPWFTFHDQNHDLHFQPNFWISNQPQSRQPRSASGSLDNSAYRTMENLMKYIEMVTFIINMSKKDTHAKHPSHDFMWKLISKGAARTIFHVTEPPRTLNNRKTRKITQTVTMRRWFVKKMRGLHILNPWVTTKGGSTKKTLKHIPTVLQSKKLNPALNGNSQTKKIENVTPTQFYLPLHRSRSVLSSNSDAPLRPQTSCPWPAETQLQSLKNVPLCNLVLSQAGHAQASNLTSGESSRPEPRLNVSLHSKPRRHHEWW